MLSSVDCFRLESICKSFQHTNVLHDLSVSIPAQKLTAITGPSGSGKTTLLSLLGALDVPDSGELWYRATNIAKLCVEDAAHLRNQAFGFVFQTNHFLPYLSVFDNVMLPVTYRRDVGDSTHYRERARLLLSRLGLDHCLQRAPQTLSGGEQQRMSIARALLLSPEVIFADEPTASLDDENSHRIMQVFTSLVADGQTVIVVSHDPLVTTYADQTFTFKHKGHDLVSV